MTKMLNCCSLLVCVIIVLFTAVAIYASIALNPLIGGLVWIGGIIGLAIIITCVQMCCLLGQSNERVYPEEVVMVRREVEVAAPKVIAPVEKVVVIQHPDGSLNLSVEKDTETI